MLHALIQVILYGLIAGFSALAFAATIAAMQAGRLKALGFGVGFVAGQLLTCSLFVFLGVTTIGSTNRSHSGVAATLELVAAFVLIALALRIRRRPPLVRDRSSTRAQRLTDRLGRLRFLTTLLSGLLLGIGGPKRLLVTAFAATSITVASTQNAGEVALVVLYVGLATALVWGPVVLFVLLGERTVALMQKAQEETSRRQREVTVYALLLVAAGLVLDAITVL